MEIDYALDLSKPILIIMLDPTELSPGLQLSLKNKQAIERFRYNKVTYLMRLLQSVRGLPQEEVPRSTQRLSRDQDSSPRSSISLAILPFDNLNNDGTHDVLADGLTQDLTTLFSRIPEFFVISRTSANAYRKEYTGVRKIGSELGVNYLIQGTVRAMSNQLRVSVELVDCKTEANVWAQTFDKEISNLFDVQDEITHTICAQLQPTLTLSELRYAERQTNLDAWSLYQKGWASWIFSFTKDASETAVEDLHAALKAEPNYAIVHASLCVICANRVATGWSEEPLTELATAHTHLRKALEIAPTNPTVCYAHAVFLNATGQRDEALGQIEKATQLEACNPTSQALAGVLISMSSESREGIRRCEHALELSPFDPRLHMLYVNLSISCYWVGAFDERPKIAWANNGCHGRVPFPVILRPDRVAIP